jgi:hypothetical protein
MKKWAIPVFSEIGIRRKKNRHQVVVGQRPEPLGQQGEARAHVRVAVGGGIRRNWSLGVVPVEVGKLLCKREGTLGSKGFPKMPRGCIFSCVRPFYERAVSNLEP